MTKAQWQAHWAPVKHDDGHDYKTCPDCRARLKTKRANARAGAVRSVYADLGMVRVRGNLGGIYYE